MPSAKSLQTTLKFIQRVARRAGEIQIDHFHDKHDIRFKGTIDIVTEVDGECEELIVGEIQKEFLGDDVLAEEGSGERKKSERRWIVDPLDGTVNYAHGFPFFCVSIALECDGELAAGVIFDPNRDEMFSAIRGEGATLNGKRIETSPISEVANSMLATGFAYNVHEEDRLDNLDHFRSFVKSAQAVRRPGSAAIDLAWLAAGRIDGFWEMFLKPWDMAAGVLIIREAGGAVTAFDGSSYDLYGTEILASNGEIHDEMSRILEKDQPQ